MHTKTAGHEDGSGSAIIVAVPALNEEKFIRQVLETLASEREHLPQIRVVVADGGSKDRTVEIASEMASKHDFITVLDNPKRLQSAAVNLVAERYGSDAAMLVRCDVHCIYPAEFIQRLKTSLEASGADSVVVPMDSVGRNCFERATAWISDTPFGSGGSAHRGGKRSGFVDHGHHAAFRMESFLKNGGYDESFSHNEDAEFDCRLNARGGRVFLDSDIRLGYFPRSTPAKLWRQYFNYGRGRSRTVRRHPSTIRLRQMVVPAHLALTVASILLALAFGSPLLLVWPLLYVAVLAAVSVSIAVKKRSACGLLSGLAGAIMHFSWASGFFWGLLTIREKKWTLTG